MSLATKLQQSAKPVRESRQILGPTGNRVRVSERPECKRNNKELLKNAQKPRIPSCGLTKVAVSKNVTTKIAVENNVSRDSSCLANSSQSGSSVKSVQSKPRVKRNYLLNSAKVVPDGVNAPVVPLKRCDWITPNSDPLYTSFHDTEWGVPVRDDNKLFELLVFSAALAELSWLAILHKRDIFRKLFDNFDPESVSKFSDDKFLSLKENGSIILSVPKLRAVVENAKQIVKIQKELGSFSNYCWRFVNHKPVRNGLRYARQIPIRTPKAEVISKDMMQRGFFCVGPSVIYSFMQVAGIVNDHLSTCFRYHECNSDGTK